MKNMDTYQPFEKWNGSVVSVRNEIMADSFNALVEVFIDANPKLTHISQKKS